MRGELIFHPKENLNVVYASQKTWNLYNITIKYPQIAIWSFSNLKIPFKQN